MLLTRLYRLAAAGAMAGLGAGILAQNAPPRIDFVRDIQPILVASCQGCHGAKAQMGQLRLDAKAPASRTFKAGNAAESHLYQRVAGTSLVASRPSRRMRPRPNGIR